MNFHTTATTIWDIAIGKKYPNRMSDRPGICRLRRRARPSARNHSGMETPNMYLTETQKDEKEPRQAEAVPEGETPSGHPSPQQESGSPDHWKVSLTDPELLLHRFSAYGLASAASISLQAWSSDFL